MKVIVDMSIDALDMTAQARDNAREIYNHFGGWDELENWAKENCAECDGLVDADAFADALHHDWDRIFADLGIEHND